MLLSPKQIISKKEKMKMSEQKIPYNIYHDEDEMPRQYLNLKAFMKDKPEPMLNPATLKPVTKDELTPVFCEACVEHELNETAKELDRTPPRCG